MNFERSAGCATRVFRSDGLTGSLRSAGPLSSEEMQRLRAEGVSLAYDPVQIGWVPVEWTDDLGRHSTGALIGAGRKAWQGAVPGTSVGRYHFRAWSSDDTGQYRDMLDDPDLWRFLPETSPGAISETQAAALIELANAAPHHIVRAVIHDDEILGQVRLSWEPGVEAHAAAPQVAELSYWLKKSARGLGHGASLAALFVADCFAAHPALVKICAKVHRQNIASQKLLERVGFQSWHEDADDIGRLIYWMHRHDRQGVASGQDALEAGATRDTE